jgi:3-oxoacyl-[acyl-carrier-protein] synthase II
VTDNPYGSKAFYGSLAAGHTALAPITAFYTSDYRSHVAGHILEFDPARFVAAARLRRIDRIGQLAIMACGLALTDANLLPERDVGSDEIGVALGSYTAGLHSLVDYLDRLNALGPIGASALDFSNTSRSMIGLAASPGTDVLPTCSIVSARSPTAGATRARSDAARLVRSGQCRRMVTGGVDDFERVFFTVHDRWGALARDAGAGEASRRSMPAAMGWCSVVE